MNKIRFKLIEIKIRIKVETKALMFEYLRKILNGFGFELGFSWFETYRRPVLRLKRFWFRPYMRPNRYPTVLYLV